MKHIKNIFVILTAIILCAACSSDDPKPPVPSIETINLSSNSTEITLGETVEFTVIANTKEDLTNKAIYFVNDNEINSNNFEPQEVGNYEIFAKYGDIKSNILNLKVNEVPIESITVTATKEEMYVGDVASLSVLSDTEKDITSEAKIYVNDELYEDTDFTTMTAGVYEIYATFGDTLQSEKIIITVNELPVTSVTITIHNNEIQSGDTVSYTVKSDTDKDLTRDAKLYVNGSLFEDGNFIPTEAGEYTIYVVYNEIKSNEVTIRVKDIPINSITLTIHNNEIQSGDTVSYTVKSDTDKDFTEEAKLYVNGSLFEDENFVPIEAGEYTIYVVYNEIKSNEVTIRVKDIPINSITLTLHNNEIQSGDTVSYTVKSDTDKDFTEEAKLYVNGSLFEDENFVPTEAGEYTIYVVYNEIKSNEVTFVIDNSEPVVFVKHPVIESFTHTKCSYCPRLFYAIEKIEEQTDQVIHISYHPFHYLGGNPAKPDFLFNSSPLPLWDAFKFKYGLNTVPNAEINRVSVWNRPQPEKLEEVTGLIDNDGVVGLAIDLAQENGKLSITVKSKFSEDFSERLMLTVYVLENNLIHDYPNVTSYFDGQNPVKDYAINHAFRMNITGIYGENIPYEETIRNNIYVKDYSVDIPQNVTDASQISIVAFITSTTTREILNARTINIGEESQSFEVK
ncbi:outer membrane protein Omp28 [Balneicella halophila]|uniref:Outer membrane protein Omp28 n=1 Tax=Balneicella halophila TaxID=1537566 RepID=A0A7L4UP39_BALHA|nr:Omp28-related outer membrane protein [Balneicella halophila]PVX50881.1 outer membrane protein Omp28 [Balneicella halophila]